MNNNNNIEDYYKTIPINLAPKYTKNDLSVVVPQWNLHKNRIVWFLKQYVKSTPPEILKNTWIIYDEKDNYTRELLLEYHDKYGILSETISYSDWSTFKQLHGFQKVKTRLCLKLHNDVCILRTDWVNAIIERFNQSDIPQILGAYYDSSDIGRETLEKFAKAYPIFKPLYDRLVFYTTDNGVEEIKAPYVTAYVTASQTYVLQSIYRQIVDFEEGRMGREDCLFTLLASLNRIKISNWENMHEFLFVVTNQRGDFATIDEFQYPVRKIDDINKSELANALWQDIT